MRIIISKRTKEIFSKTVMVILVIFTILGLVSLMNYFVSTFDDDDMTKINPSYEIGALTSYGKYIESDGAIYTKEAFECKGLQITPEFDSTITYQIFFYDYLGNFIDSTDVLESAYRDSIPAGATHARIMITPKWEDSVKEDDRKINIFQIMKYSKQLTVKVLKEQGEIVEMSEIAVFENVTSDFDFSDSLSYQMNTGAYAYQNTTLFEDSTISKIGVPVKSVLDHTKDNVLTVYVLDSSNLSSKDYIEKYELVIKSNTFDSNTVNDWYYFDNLNIRVENGQTLAFVASTDGVIPAYNNNNTGTYSFFNYCASGSDCRPQSKSIYWDIYIRK